MTAYETIFLLFATTILLATLSAGYIRGTVWVVAICMDVLASDAYVQAGLPVADAFMGACDFVLCLAIYAFAAARWERLVFLIFMFSMLVSVLHLAADVAAPGWIDRETYLLVLEVANYVACIVIGTAAGYRYADRKDAAAFLPWRRFLPLGDTLRRFGAKN